MQATLKSDTVANAICLCRIFVQQPYTIVSRYYKTQSFLSDHPFPTFFFPSFLFLSTSLIESSPRYYLRWFSLINQKYKRPWHGLIIVIFYLTSSRITTITVLYFTSIAATVPASSHERSLFANLLFQGAFRPSEHEHSARTTTFARVCLINVNVHRANLFVNRAALKDALLRDDR